MTYTRSQIYTNMVVGEHGIQTFEIVVIVLFLLLLLSDKFFLSNAHSLLFLSSGLSKYILMSVKTCCNFSLATLCVHKYGDHVVNTILVVGRPPTCNDLFFPRHFPKTQNLSQNMEVAKVVSSSL